MRSKVNGFNGGRGHCCDYFGKRNIKNILLLCIVTSLLGSMFGCSGAPVAAIKDTPVLKTEFTELPFRKIINPAFADEVAGKYAKFTAKFNSIDSDPRYVHSQDRAGRVVFSMVDKDSTSDSHLFNTIPKNKSDILFELKNLETIEVYAHLLRTQSAVGAPVTIIEVINIKKLR